jgi:putative phosphoesterase
MRVAVLSDIHGNLTALEAVKADLAFISPDLVLHGGDLAANGARPAEVIDVIRDAGWRGTCGNTDEMLWRPEMFSHLESLYPAKHVLRRVLFKDIAPVTCEMLGTERLRWLRQLPRECHEHDIAVLHASPHDLWRAPLNDASDDELRMTYGVLTRKSIVYGHIHRPFVRDLGEMTVANSGSVGLPYDGDIRASYAIVQDGAVRIRRVEYNVDREIRELKIREYPHAQWVSSILRTALYCPPF